ncbi:MAG: Hsp20/alpha crystallin family protein [bacterium]|nr:Hsp20/alpha crystallin family protein [bacterium]
MIDDEEIIEEEAFGEEKAEAEAPVEPEIDLVKSGSAVRERRADASEEFTDDDEGQLTIDLYQNSDEIILESPIAGVKPEDLDIAITSESVTIRGKREKEKRIKDEDYFYQECYWGRFARSIILPQEVDAEKSEAAIKNGVLVIRLPKLNRQRSKKIKVQAE